MDEGHEFSAFSTALQEALEPVGLGIGAGDLERLWQHFECVRQANTRVNLTRITDPAEAAVKHYADSLTVVEWARQQRLDVISVLDIGTGAGFPAIPLAIYRPQWQITAIDGTAKKVQCVESFIEALQLINCRVLHQRAEHWSEPVPDVDLIVVRALGPVADTLKKARRLCRRDTVVVSYKTDPAPPDEMAAAAKAAQHRGFETLPNWPYRLTWPAGTIAHQLCCYRYVKD